MDGALGARSAGELERRLAIARTDLLEMPEPDKALNVETEERIVSHLEFRSLPRRAR